MAEEHIDLDKCERLVVPTSDSDSESEHEEYSEYDHEDSGSDEYDWIEINR